MNVSRRHLYKLGFLTILTKMLFTGLDEKTLAVLLNFKGDELKECLDKLVKDRILQEEYLDGSDEKFYFVSYQVTQKNI